MTFWYASFRHTCSSFLVRVPRDQTLPVLGDLPRPLPNIGRCIQQEQHTGRIRFGSESIDHRKPTSAQTAGPMLDLSVVSTCMAGVMVIDDQATSWPCQRQVSSLSRMLLPALA